VGLREFREVEEEAESTEVMGVGEAPSETTQVGEGEGAGPMVGGVAFGWRKVVDGYVLCDLYSRDEDCDMVVDKFVIATIQNLADDMRCSERFVYHLFQTLGFEAGRFRVMERLELARLGRRVSVGNYYIDEGDVGLLGLDLWTERMPRTAFDERIKKEVDEDFRREGLELVESRPVIDKDELSALNYLIELGLRTRRIKALIEVILMSTCFRDYWVIVYNEGAKAIVVFPDEPMYEKVEELMRGE